MVAVSSGSLAVTAGLCFLSICLNTSPFLQNLVWLCFSSLLVSAMDHSSLLLKAFPMQAKCHRSLMLEPGKPLDFGVWGFLEYLHGLYWLSILFLESEVLRNIKFLSNEKRVRYIQWSVSLKKACSGICHSIGWRHYVQWNKPVPER